MPLREGFAVGAVAAVIWSAVLTLRVAVTTSVGVATVLPLLLCACLMLVPPVVALGSRARLGNETVARAALLAALLASGPLAVLGVLVHDKTHHRPLGAATLAIVSLAVIAVAALVARRLLAGPFGTTARATPRPLVRRGLVAAAGLSLLGTVAVAVRAGGGPVSWALLDVALAAAAIGASIRLRARLRRLVPVGVVTWALASAGLVVVLRGNAEAARALRAAAPVPLAVVVIDR
jgi:hypothetical protein